MKAGATYTDENGHEWKIEYVGATNVKVRRVGSVLTVAWLPKDIVEEMLNEKVG